jgi:hypothetical protein
VPSTGRPTPLPNSRESVDRGFYTIVVVVIIVIIIIIIIISRPGK